MAKKAELKTQKTAASADDFLNSIKDEQVRADCMEITKMMKQATKAEPKMWGASIVGFGDFHYKYASGRENDWFLLGFSPRKQNLTLYIMNGLEQHNSLLKKLGKHTTGVGCLYIKKLADVDKKTLKEIMANAVKDLKKK
jgi:hypothetical protein